MHILIPEDVPFKISTTDMNVFYSERGGAKILLDVLSNENGIEKNYYSIQIFFEVVAEFKCITLNYYELNYENYKIESDSFRSSNYSEVMGFYQVKKSTFLQQSLEKYDPKRRLNLSHYLIIGNDSYIELLASRYSISYTNQPEFCLKE